jgi:tetratricopeptide (TPR) repeat protein
MKKMVFGLGRMALALIFAAGVFAQSADFEIKDGVLVKYKGMGGNVTVPKGVTAIGERAFYLSSLLNTVHIPDGVTSIGKEAFYMCYGLSSVNIPDGVISIGHSAFAVCASLTSIHIPDSVTDIAALAFNATSLKTVSLSRKTKLGNNSFPDTAQLIYRDADGSAAAGGLTARDYNSRGLAFFQKGDYDSALADYSQAIRLDPDYGDAYIGRGMTCYLKKDYDQAIADFTQAIRLIPNPAEVYNGRANAYAMKNDFVRAKADWEKTLELDPGNTGARNNLGMLQQLGY